MSRRSNLSMEKRGGFLVIRPDGRLGLGEAEEMSAILGSVFDRGENYLAVDLSDVTFISSMCMGVLVQAHQELKRRNGRMVIGNVGPDVERTLSYSRLKDVFEITEDLEALLQTSEQLVDQAQSATSSDSGEDDSDDIF